MNVRVVGSFEPGDWVKLLGGVDEREARPKDHIVEPSND